MTNEEIATYLRFLAMDWKPSDRFLKNVGRPDPIVLGRCMLLAAADQIENGTVERWYAARKERKDPE